MREPRWVNWVRVIVLSLLGLFTLAPIYVMVSSSVKPLVDVSGTFHSIPRGLDESAHVDGAGPLRTLFSVILPTALPGVVAVSVYSFMTAWGELLFASVMTDESSRTLAVGLQGYATSNDVYWNQVMAASLVVSVPVVTGFLLLQRHFVAGLTAGAVK